MATDVGVIWTKNLRSTAMSMTVSMGSVCCTVSARKICTCVVFVSSTPAMNCLE